MNGEHPTAWRRVPRAATALLAAAAALVGCRATPTPAAPSACESLAGPEVAATLPVPRTVLLSATVEAATASAPRHCRVDGEIDRRTGIDGQRYAIRFRLRLPESGWNGRFFMGGGGGTNGNLVDPVARLAEGYATIGTDGGHDNATNTLPETGGTAAFGADPQARIDFGYAAYDKVTRVGKALVQRRYGTPAHHAYFAGCSEGGREAMLMTQRFPDHYDGVIAGDPVLHLPLGPLSGIYTTQLFAGLAKRAGHLLPDGSPALGRSYSDADLLLVRNAILGACDALDGLADGIVDDQPSCTTARVAPALDALRCAAGKTAACLSGDQIDTLKRAYLGTFDSRGRQLYVDWQWDPGVGGRNGAQWNQAWRSWWLGRDSASANNAIKLNYATALAVAYTSPPRLPSPVSKSLEYALGYDFDTEPGKLYAPSGAFSPSAAELFFTDATDLSRFRDRGGRMMLYHGASDSAVSVNDTLNWYRAMGTRMGGAPQSFARMFVVPGMAHCSGGPATDRFDMLPQLVDWVERGVAPDAVVASASNPGYFGVAARSRPLCPYPQQARYRGNGSIDEAASFVCR